MVEPKKTRSAAIADLVAAAEKQKKSPPTFFVWFKGERQPFLQITLPTNLLLYNVKNGRTQTAQLEHIEKNNLSADFFEDPEDAEVQTAQEKILLTMVGDEDLDEDIEEKGQENPLVVTHDGIVVDGNRRLAILRTEGKTQALAVVLPSTAKPADIYETEVVIQMSRDTKAEYNWVNELRVVNRGLVDLKLDKKAIAKLRRTSPENIEKDVRKLKVVDMFLEWLGEPGKYNRIPTTQVSDGEEIFKQLTDRLYGKEYKNKDEATQSALKNTSFGAIRAKGGYKDLRKIWTHLPKKAHDILERSATNPDWPAKPEPAKKPGAKLGPLAKAKGKGSSGTPAVVELAAIFADPKTGTQAAQILMTTVEQIDEEEKSLRKFDPLQLIDKARIILEGVEVGSGIPKAEYAKALKRLEEQVDRIQSDIEEM